MGGELNVPFVSYRMLRTSRRFRRFFGRSFSTRRTRLEPEMPKASAISIMVVRDGLYLARSRRLMYFAWYPLFEARASCDRARSLRNWIKTRANALFSEAAVPTVLPCDGIRSTNTLPAQCIIPQSILSHETETHSVSAKGQLGIKCVRIKWV